LKAGRGKHRGLKLVTCICFLLIVVALLLIDRHSPATGYELSIYESLPAAVWFCLIAALAGGTGIVVQQAFAGHKSKYWLLGFLLLMFGVSIVLLLPAFRGYYLYGASDSMVHARWTGRLLSEGHLRQNNGYPMTHILMAQVAHVCDASPEVITKYIPPLFSILFVLYTYLLARSVMGKRGPALLSVAATALFFGYYHVSTYPQALSVMMLPIVFYLYFEGFGTSSVPFRVAFVIVLLLFPFSHPAPAAVLIVCLLAAEAAKAIWRARRAASSSVAREVMARISFEPTLISTVTFLTWISSVALMQSTISRVWFWLGGEIQSIPRVTEIEQMFESQGLGIHQQVELALKMYGDNLIYLSLSAIALLIIAWRFWRRQHEVKNLFILSMPFLISGPVWVFVFAATLAVTLGRLLGANIMMWATPVLAAFALHEIFARWKRVGIVVVTSILLCASVIGILGVYHSPHILQTSWQITRQDVHGSGWFSAHARLRFERGFVNLGVASLLPGWLTVPEHFGYPQDQTLGEALEMDTYVLVSEMLRLSTSHRGLPGPVLSPWAQIKFNQTDFQRLEQDPTVNRLYSNGELEVLMVVAESGA